MGHCWDLVGTSGLGNGVLAGLGWGMWFGDWIMDLGIGIGVEDDSVGIIEDDSVGRTEDGRHDVRS
jgi:hypothetical protein